ncbi:cysteine-rich CWC family protein [Priestia flexa]|uniref:Cysteine-rich CWC family protein n=1 Tax=Priestia flexa TaxID=86664 RepID=A0ABU4J9R9_9BACI|nr:cysteine-rich CWC family protein [Priestia flexa]MCA1201267.1 cysteine-rich CWC family protein [Priestia flexa]MCG7312403.1 cysteine-rich CWC family protein [Priestia flexa]MDW8517738.1 cysteine-rich CWC family protein [Priestia flexa]MEC0665894.1 cysteine-rich CWC family protein [Priestia flexa]MED3824506.1 cysteine-rich CWC family protein [Priestia flexa]
MINITCPLCGKKNGCQHVLKEEEFTCWCAEEEFPDALKAKSSHSCICKSCLQAYKESQREE